MAGKTDSLKRYKEKRNFSRTPEPPAHREKQGGHRYLIQKHAASHLHYDFRLELDGVLKSWAVPKGPSFDPADKRLAMEVEDHPVAYGSFEGIIPKGQYGGGTVMLWDEGTWEPMDDPRKGLEKGKLTFKLHGERLKGEWTLVRFHGHDNKRNHWFLIKHKDDEVIEGDNGGFVEKNLTSVVSGRTMDEIAADKDKVWKSKKTKEGATAPVKKITRNVKKSTGKLPAFIPPQLATLSTAMPKGGKWLHEIKFDGYRMLAYVENGKALMMSRNNKDWTGAFQPIADLVAALPVNAIIDGEVVAMNAEKKSSFSDLKNALSTGDYAHIQYYVFDLLYLDGQDVRKQSLFERKELLKKLLVKLPAKARKRIFFSDHFTDAEGKFFEGVCSMHLEGVISKRSDAPYLSGRSKSWLKTKCIRRQEFVIGGYTLPSNGSKGIGALLLGYYDGDELEYAGRVGTGWGAELSAKIRTMLNKRAAKQCPFVSVTVEGRRKAKWVRPELVGEVEFTEWTPDGHLRHPSFEGLREDKTAKEVTRDFAEPVEKAAQEAVQEVKRKKPAGPPAKPRTKSPDAGDVVVDDIKITHPSRIIYPGTGITKQQLAEYYASVSKHILPHIVNRPISMLRCPEGAEETCFYQRHVGLGKSPYLHEISIGVKGENRDYMMIKDEKGLISLVQWGVIEIHPWQCTAAHLDKPDRIIFDLDPDPAVKWPRMVEAAHEVQSRMKELGLESFLKTTGGKGLHVVVPMTPAYGWETIKAFARTIAQSMATDSPERYIATMSKAKRKGLIFVDYLRNEVTSTAVTAFSARARKGATVSTPLDWKELNASLKLSSFTIESVTERLAKLKKDPWAGFFKVRQKIAAKYLKALKIET